MALPTLSVTPGTGATINTLPNAPALTANSVSVALATDQPAVLVTAASLPLPSGAAQDGADGTGIAAPTGGSGIRGWLSGIYAKLSGTIAVSGTFWPATQPVSLASLPALVAGSALIGKVSVDQTTPGSTNGVTEVGSSNWAASQVSVSSAATSLVSARSARHAIVVTNLGTADVWLGGAGVTVSTGTLLPGVKGACKAIPATTAVYGIVASGSQVVSVEELY
jgi:hypothetical protein